MKKNSPFIGTKTITLENGEEYKGNIIEETDDIIKLKAQNLFVRFMLI